MRKAYNFYKSYAEIIKKLNNEQAGRFIKALNAVQFLEVDIDEISFEDDPILDIAWTAIKPLLEQQIEGAKNKFTKEVSLTHPSSKTQNTSHQEKDDKDDDTPTQGVDTPLPQGVDTPLAKGVGDPYPKGDGDPLPRGWVRGAPTPSGQREKNIEKEEEKEKREREKSKRKEKEESIIHAYACVRKTSLRTCDELPKNSPPLETDSEKPPEIDDIPEIEQLNLNNKLPPCPYKEIVELYHMILLELPKVHVLNETRKRYLQTRWREVLARSQLQSIFLRAEELQLPAKKRGLLWFQRYFEYVRESDFLCGRTPPSQGRDSPFIADFEWLIRPTNFAKVLEGRYHRRMSVDLSRNAYMTALAAQELLEKWQKQERKEARHVEH